MNWIDTSLLVYALVPGHPAAGVVDTELRRDSWGSGLAVLVEVYQVLVRDYAVAPQNAAQAIARLTRTNVHWAAMDATQVMAAAALRARYRLQSADAILFLLVSEDRGTLVTVDRRLLRTAQGAGIAVRNPIPSTVSAEIAQWEAERFPPKGLGRILSVTERWIRTRDAGVATEFVQATAGLTALPL